MTVFSRSARPLRVAATFVSGGLLALTALLPAAAQTVPAAGAIELATTDGRPETRNDELLVKFRPGTPAHSQAAAHQQASGQVVREVRALDVKVVKVHSGQGEQRLNAYRRNPNVEYVELNGIAYASGTPTPNDPYYTNGSLWGLHNTGQSGGKSDADIDAPQTWAKVQGSAAVRIAVLDTGVRESHPDLAGKVVDRADWTADGQDSADDGYGHGTHVAGTIAALTNNGMGVAGVCQDCTLINGKVLSDDGGGAYDWIASGVLWAAGCQYRVPAGAPLLSQTCVDTNGNAAQPLVKVMNLSLGGAYNSRVLQDAVTVAARQGVVLACAAGNSGTSRTFYPAGYSECIAVAATDRLDSKASFSNFGSKWVDVAAPGVDIVSTLPTSGSLYTSESGYAFWSGTSMATPHVAGLAGLLWSQGLTSNAAVRQKIESTADLIGGTGRYWSKGRINACRAVGGTGC